MTTNDIDFDRLLRANLERVFNERDEDKRRTAIAELFVEEPVMYEPTKIVRGRLEISRVAGELLKQFGPTFRSYPMGLRSGIMAWRVWPGMPDPSKALLQ